MENQDTPVPPPREDPDTPSAPSPKKRLLSLDALRGFDMFWIVGGEHLVGPLFAVTGWTFLRDFQVQLRHCRWNGFHFEDLIFPLFIFLSGVTLGLSGRPFRELDRKEKKKKYIRAVRRLLLLVAIGILYNRAHGWGNFLSWDGPRYMSVLGRIGFAWFFCAMIVWHLRPKWQYVLAGGILLAYWAVQALAGGDAAANIWVDQHITPGFLYGKNMDPEGLLSNIPSIVNALMGAFAGRWIVSRARLAKKVGYLALAGAILLALGWSWNEIYPVNKRIWTGSYVLVTAGWSCLLFSLFYLLADGWGLKRFGKFWAVIGANALPVYIGYTFIHWTYTSDRLFGGFIEWTPKVWHPLLLHLGVLVLEWLLLAWLYKRKIFIRV